MYQICSIAASCLLIIIIINYIYIALFWVLKALYIERGNLLNHHQCAASTWMIRRQPYCARMPTTHQLIGGEDTEWWSQSVYRDDLEAMMVRGQWANLPVLLTFTHQHWNAVKALCCHLPEKRKLVISNFSILCQLIYSSTRMEISSFISVPVQFDNLFLSLHSR